MAMEFDGVPNEEKLIKNPEISILYRKMVRIETILLGVPNTDAGGLVHDIRCIKEHCEVEATIVQKQGEDIHELQKNCIRHHETPREDHPAGPSEAPEIKYDPRLEVSNIPIPGIPWYATTKFKVVAILGGLAAIIAAITELIKLFQ